MVITISASVGQGGVNRKSDVRLIQQVLNMLAPNQGGTTAKIKEDGSIGPKTIGAIIAFQKANGLGADGRIDRNGSTIAKFNTLLASVPELQRDGPNFTKENLYYNGVPTANDINQDAF